MDRAIPVSNRVLARRWDEQNQAIHYRKLQAMRPLVDSSPPISFPKSPKKAKKEQLLEERYTEIERENRLLLEKMSNIMQSRASRTRSVKKRSLNEESRKREVVKISAENQALLRRMQDRQSNYNTQKWEIERRRTERMLQNICHYPYQLGVTEEFSRVRLGSVDSRPEAGFSQTATVGKRPKTRKLYPISQEEIVFKRIVTVGGRNFLIEIAEQPRAVLVTAYDIDNPDNYALKLDLATAVQMMGYEKKYERLAELLVMEEGELRLLSPQELPSIPEPRTRGGSNRPTPRCAGNRAKHARKGSHDTADLAIEQWREPKGEKPKKGSTKAMDSIGRTTFPVETRSFSIGEDRGKPTPPQTKQSLTEAQGPDSLFAFEKPEQSFSGRLRRKPSSKRTETPSQISEKQLLPEVEVTGKTEEEPEEAVANITGIESRKEEQGSEIPADSRTGEEKGELGEELNLQTNSEEGNSKAEFSSAISSKEEEKNIEESDGEEKSAETKTELVAEFEEKSAKQQSEKALESEQAENIDEPAGDEGKIGAEEEKSAAGEEERPSINEESVQLPAIAASSVVSESQDEGNPALEAQGEDEQESVEVPPEESAVKEKGERMPSEENKEEENASETNREENSMPVDEKPAKEMEESKEEKEEERQFVQEEATVGESLPVVEATVEENLPVKEEAAEENLPVKEEAAEENFPVKEEAAEEESFPVAEAAEEESLPVKEVAEEESLPVKEVAEEESLPVVEEAAEVESFPVVEATVEESFPVAEAAEEESLPVKEEAAEESFPVVEATVEESFPVAEAAEEESLPVVEATVEESLPIVEAAEEASLPVVEAVAEESLPVLEAAVEESLPVKEEATVEESLPVKEEAAEENLPVKEEAVEENLPVVEAAVEENLPVVEAVAEENLPVVEAIVEENLPIEEEKQAEIHPITEPNAESDKSIVDEKQEAVVSILEEKQFPASEDKPATGEMEDEKDPLENREGEASQGSEPIPEVGDKADREEAEDGSLPPPKQEQFPEAPVDDPTSSPPAEEAKSVSEEPIVPALPNPSEAVAALGSESNQMESVAPVEEVPVVDLERETKPEDGTGLEVAREESVGEQAEASVAA